MELADPQKLKNSESGLDEATKLAAPHGHPPPSAVCQKLLLCAQAPGLGQSESERACAVLLLLLAPKRSPARHSLCPLPPSVSPPANPPPLRRPAAVVWTASLVCDGPSHEKEFSPAQTLWI